ncbi:FecR domain-containing protein [Pedobacter sp. PWIIR3]
MKLDARMYIGEVIEIMRDKELDHLPVYENNEEIGVVFYDELLKFLGDPDDESNVYFHKLNFNLSTVLHILRDKQEIEEKNTWSVLGLSKHYLKWFVRLVGVSVLAVALIGISWAIYKKFGAHGESTIQEAPASKSKMVTLKTAAGETKEATLPDGSKIWLNAASTLEYPVSFEGLKEREIFLDGEAYIEPTAGKPQPFVIKTNRQRIVASEARVSVSAYGNEKEQVVQYSPSDAESANVHSAIAWTKGDFLFHDQPLGAVMRELERWYGVNVVYQDEEMSNMLIGASISRKRSLEEVLKVIGLTQHVNFSIIGKQVVVSK